MAMQASELKAIRKELGLTQDALADALGLSRVMIGLMERGEAAIERRTELAVHYLAEHPELIERKNSMNRKITAVEFEAICAKAETIRETDYRSCVASGPVGIVRVPLIGGKAAAMGYIGAGPAGELGDHYFAA